MSVEQTESWDEVGETWCCPCCMKKRDACEVTVETGEKRRWLVYHHDHMRDYVKYCIKSRYGSVIPPLENKALKEEVLRYTDIIKRYIVRFDETLLCLDCNEVEGKIKKEIRCDKYFSFHYFEIRRAFISFDNERHYFLEEHMPFFEKLYTENYDRLVSYRKSIVEALVKRAYERDLAWGGPIKLENHFTNHELFITFPVNHSKLLIEASLKEGKPVLDGFPWTKEQNEVLIQLYNQKIKFAEIAKKIGRTPGAVKRQLTKLEVIKA